MFFPLQLFQSGTTPTLPSYPHDLISLASVTLMGKIIIIIKTKEKLRIRSITGFLGFSRALNSEGFMLLEEQLDPLHFNQYLVSSA